MITARRMATVVILIISGAGFAASDMELYDDFDGGDRVIDPDKWQGIEVSDGGNPASALQNGVPSSGR